MKETAQIMANRWRQQ